MSHPTTNGRGIRKRGAQPGNRNSLKKGFYSPIFEGDELELLGAAMAPGLQDEITMLRMVTFRALKLSWENDDPQDSLHLVDAMGKAAKRLASLLKTQETLTADSDDVAAAITKALSGLIEEIKQDGRHVNT
jgi:hypothetical protein